ncbi:Cation/H+ exchanger [Penicillium longicatenatum]|uniref:Cation/H+ exchanger n=1 Tax=Penicillium longicatenatum TaxID=1561947 RepID=UPI0025498BFA|nr:Cation/H+ exchanger [Penicillium longicatenatum]KAJ5643146.1 Cation/H+ exchanger [Penicillium longicatenatum]
MPTLALINFNIVCATLGGFVSIFGLVSYLCKERFYLSEALISLLAGVVFSPHAANFIRPEDYALHSSENLAAITLHFTRLVLGVQLVLAGVQLPKRYLHVEWRSLSLLLGPGMAAMWICSSLIVWAMVPNFKFLHALIVAACVTPTDPVLSNSIVKGKFADKHVPRPLQRIIVAESGANDGLGYPFLFFGIYLLKYIGMGGEGYSGGAGKAIGLWFYETWVYTIILSIVYGAVVGWISRKLLHWAEEKHYCDRESFLVFAIALALFVVGTCGLIGTDDLLACFIAGNVFTQDDWFRLETIDDSLQPTIDMLLNLSMFMWFGAVCPWSSFLNNDIIPIYRLIFLGILILLVRRMPIIFAMHKYIHQIEDLSHAAFVGFFGPIGVGAIFYLSICREFLLEIKVDGQVREDAQRVADTASIVVWFLAICSIVNRTRTIRSSRQSRLSSPRTLSTAITASSTAETDPIPIEAIRRTHSTATPIENDASSFRSRRRRQYSSPTPPLFRLGRSKIPSPSPSQAQPGVGQTDEPERPVNLVIHEPTTTAVRHDDSSASA